MTKNQIEGVSSTLVFIERAINEATSIAVPGCSDEMEFLLSELLEAVDEVRRQLQEEALP